MKVKIKKSGKLIIKVDDEKEIATLLKMSSFNLSIPDLLYDVHSSEHKIIQKFLSKLFKKIEP